MLYNDEFCEVRKGKAMSSGLQVVILAAGKGSRMKSANAKVLQKVGKIALIDHVLATVERLKAPKTIVVVGHEKESVKTHLRHATVSFADQEILDGTGGALRVSLPLMSDKLNTLVLLGDTPFISVDDINRMIDHDADVVVLGMELDNPEGYGRLITDEHGNLTHIIEHKEATDEQLKVKVCNSGVMLFKHGLLEKYLPKLKCTNKANEYYLTDIIALMNNDGLNATAVVAADSRSLSGANSHADLSKLESYYRHKRASELLGQGVLVQDISRVDLTGTIKCGKDVEICSDVEIIGPVNLEDGVIIGKGCQLINCTVGENAVIKPYSLIEDSEIGKRAQIGPFARIRPGTKVGIHAKIGNFVETKKSNIGTGSKVSHLSYIGDAEIGQDVNIGAGTITCNYDGVNKFTTCIKDNSFIGSNTALVAPVTVEQGATIGAGSVITKTAPPNQLSLTRVKQITMKSWQRPEKK